MEEQWNLVISSLQDICNTNVVRSYEDDLQLRGIESKAIANENLQKELHHCNEHLKNVKRAQRLTESIREGVKTILTIMEETRAKEKLAKETPHTGTGTGGTCTGEEDAARVATPEAKEVPAADSPAVQESPQQSQQSSGPSGRSAWISQYNPNGPISVGSEVAFKPKKGGEGEWFQCVVVKVSSDGLRFEVRDPEPDELGNPGKTFKCNWKDVIFITPERIDQKSRIPNYPSGTKVLARYPETTTFYPAVVIGTKRDGTCRLKFDGEEEVDKETEVLRRLVLPCPTISSTMAKK